MNLRTALVRSALQDLRCFLGQHFPFLGKRHSSSRPISSSSMDSWMSVTWTLFPLGPKVKTVRTSTESAENLQYGITSYHSIKYKEYCQWPRDNELTFLTYYLSHSPLQTLFWCKRHFDTKKIYLSSPVESPKSIPGSVPNILYIPIAFILGSASRTSHVLEMK